MAYTDYINHTDDGLMHLPYIDARPLLAANQPETREYYTVFVGHDQQYGQPSATIKVVVPG